MQQHAAVAAGAGVGALVRWAITATLSGAPLLTGVVFVNLMGTALLAVVLYHPRVTSRIRSIAGTGFCGGLTTFSAVALASVGQHDGVHAFTGIAVAVLGLPVSLALFRVVAARTQKQCAR